MQTSSDMGRFVRNIKAVIGTDYQEAFFEEQLGLAERVVEMLPVPDKMNTATIREDIRSNTEIRDELKRSIEKTLMKVRKDETKSRPIQLVEKATTCLESVDINILQKLGSNEKLRLIEQLNKLEQAVEQIQEKL